MKIKLPLFPALILLFFLIVAFYAGLSITALTTSNQTGRTIHQSISEIGKSETAKTNRLSLPPGSDRHSAGFTKDNGDATAQSVRIFLKHGLISEGLSALKQFRDSSVGDTWSAGRFCWYMSLYYRTDGNHGAARAWARRAKNHGISELGADEKTFWLQFDAWDRPPRIEIIRERLALIATQSPFMLTAEKSDPAGSTKGIVNEIRKANSQEPSILDQVRLATWELLLGEYTAAHEDLHLPTTSIDSLLTGKKHLKELEARIDNSPELEDEVSTDPRLAIRLDTARVRAIVFKQKEELSRDRELARLEQLQQIARTYRDLNEDLIRWQTYQALEDRQKTADTAKKALRQLNAIFEVVNDRKDYHLFDGEPEVDGNPGSDFAILETQPVPFADNPLSMLKSLQGLAYYNLIRNQEKPDNEIIEKAEIWAKAALEDGQDNLEVPAGKDSNNLIARLLLGLIADSRGERLAFSDDKNERDKATDYFAQAKETLQAFLDQLRQQNYDDSTRLVEVTEQKLKHLNSVDTLTEDARAKADTNQPETARRSLEIATKRHRDPATALEAIEIGHRAGMPLAELENEWNRYVQLEILDAASLEAQLMLAKIRNLRAGQALGRPGEKEKKKSAAELLESRRTLEKWAEDRNLPDPQRMTAKANLALAFSYGWALGDPNGDGSKVKQADIEATHRHAQDAIAVLMKRLDGKDPADDTVEELRMREALIAARIAAGHLYYMHLAEHRDESKLEFHAAADEAGRMNNAPPVLPLIGSPLLRQVFEQSEGGESKLANQERQRRRMITLWLEAMYTEQFGASNQAVNQMQKAEDLAFGGEGNPEENMAQIDAAQLAAAADGFDAKVTLPDTCRAFTVLTLIKAGMTDHALVKAVRLASKQTLQPHSAAELTEEELASCEQMVQSPLVAFTLAKAIESYGADIPLEEQLEHREALMIAAGDSYERGLSLLKSERVAERYPHMLAVIKQSIGRLNNPKPFLENAVKLAKERRLDEAISETVMGLRRHPRNQSLWQAYFNFKLERLKYGKSNKHDELALLHHLEVLNGKGLISGFEAAFNKGIILEALGQHETARESFLEASQLAENLKDMIRAKSNAARLLATMYTAQRTESRNLASITP